MENKLVPSFNWQLVAIGEQGPGLRSRHCLVYDRNAKAAILFGGIVWDSHSRLRSDTWEFRDRKWHQVRTAQEPPARHRGAMVYDDHHRQSVLFGGQGTTADLLGDTWIFQAGYWRRWRTPWWGKRPSPRCGHSLAYDESRGLTVLFGGIGRGDHALGDTWLFDGSSWIRGPRHGPAPRRYAAFAYDADLKGCLLQGGAEDDHGHRTFGDTWLFRENAWMRLGSCLDTTPRDDHGLAYHYAANRMVMLEGINAPRGVLVRETDRWQAVETNPLHPRHQCAPLVWDERQGGLLLHGGELRHGGPQLDATMLLKSS